MSNNGGVYTFSKTAALNASADSTQNWAEGMAPSAVNDSARALLASVAKYRDDISGAIVTTGTSAAYIVASNQVFDTLADFHGQVIAFTPHVTNAAGPNTMTVDGFANLPLRTSPGKELLAGTIIQGTPYTAVYNNTDGSLYLRGFFDNPYNVPLGAGMDYWAGLTAPSSSFAFPRGQAISRTTYASLFNAMGTLYGSGDGSNTFNLPDKSGRVSAMLELAQTRLTGAGFGGNSTIYGATGGTETETAPLPAHTHANTLTDPGHTHTFSVPVAGGGSGWASGGSNTNTFQNAPITGASVTGIVINNASAGAGGAHNNVQPTIVCNYIMRII